MIYAIPKPLPGKLGLPASYYISKQGTQLKIDESTVTSFMFAAEREAGAWLRTALLLSAG